MTIGFKKAGSAGKSGLAAWVMTGAVLAVAGPAQSQTSMLGGDTVVSDVTVVGKVKPKSPLRNVPGFGRASASSCGFSPGSFGVAHTQGYLQSLGYDSDIQSLASIDPYAPQTAEVEKYMQASIDRYRRGSVSVYGDASRTTYSEYGSYSGYNSYISPASQFTQFDDMNVCRGQYGLMAGRAHIILKDKTLYQARAFFRAGKYPEALAMFRQAERKLSVAVGVGGDEAALMIGKMSLYGLGTKVDVAEARRYLDMAASSAIDISWQLPAFDPNNPDDSLIFTSEAAVILAEIYLTGYETPKNPAKARSLLKRANMAGYVPAAKMLGDLYYYGRDTPQDYKQAARYYGEAAKLGYAPAQHALGDLYYRGEGVAQNLTKALAWYNAAAKLEHPDALYALAVAYDTGEGVVADEQKALGFYKIAAINGSVDAQSAIGSSFYEGGILPKDPAIARKWFETAASRGQADAMLNLAAMQMRGEGGERNVVKAWAWLKRAQAEGHPNAAPALSVLESRMSPAERATAAEMLVPKKVS